ncbi:MAG: hypothetical protein RLP44_31960 [Aggregatilineales bacterium]
MSDEARLAVGIILLTVPTIEYGGYFLLSLYMKPADGFSNLQLSMFRAGHAHAGVIVILSLVLQLFVDSADLSSSLAWFVRIGAPLSAILISAGFFASVRSSEQTRPDGLIRIVYAGALLLMASLVVLGVGLIGTVL